MASPKVEIPSPPGRPGGLGDYVEKTIKRAFGWVIEQAHDVLVSVIQGGVRLVLEGIEAELAPRVRPMVDQVLEVEGLPDGLRAMFEGLRAPGAQVEAIGLGGIASATGSSAATAILAPIMRMVNYAIDRQVRSALPDPNALYAMKWRGALDLEKIVHPLAYLGWSNTYIDAWEKILRPRLAPLDLLAWYRLSDRSLKTAKHEIEQQGWLGDDVDRMIDLSKFKPGPQDLIRMAVREAWRDDIAAEWGYDEDFPAEFAEWMSKLGDEDGWSRKYWRAHWDLPGLTTVLEILHRVDAFDLDDLTTYLRTADVPATYRDYIRQIAYTPYTRVDVRRMYQEGVLSEEEVFRAHTDIGYDNERARKLTEWTIKEYDAAGKELSKGDVLDAHKRGLVSSADALDMLAAIGYSEAAAEYYISRNEFLRAQDELDDQLEVLEKRYKRGLVDDQGARDEMTALGLTSRLVEHNITLWAASKSVSERRPTVSKLEAFYRTDIIDADRFTDDMLGLGYDVTDIPLYLRLLDAEKAAAAAAEVERARKEATRLDAEKKATAYSRSQAVLDAEIAEQQLVIASAQQALNAARGARDVLEIEDRLDVIREEVSATLASIAATRESAATAKATLDSKIAEVEREELYTFIEEAERAVETIETDIAEARAYIAELRAYVVGEVDDVVILEVKQNIADAEAHIAQQKLAQQEIQEGLLAARQRLRARITDTERQELERIIRQGGVDVRVMQTHIAELRAEREVLRIALEAELSGDQRQVLEEAVAQARTEIRRLQLEKAELKKER